MKKKLYSLILTFALIFSGVMFLTACDKNKGKTPEKQKYNVSAEVTFESYPDDNNYVYANSIIFSLGSASGGGGILGKTTQYSCPTVEENSTSTITITYNNGYDLNTITVTEKSGKNFTKTIGTQDNANKLYISFTPNADSNYKFSVSDPQSIIKTVAFDNTTDISTITSDNKSVYDFLTNAKIYVENDGFINIATQSNNGIVSNLEDKLVNVDMSKTYGSIYVRFDPTTKQKLVYENNALNNLFVINNNTTLSFEGYDEDKQAYKFQFYTSIIENNSEIKLVCDSNTLKYKTYSVNTSSDIKLVYNDQYSKKLKFKRTNQDYSKQYNEEKTFVFEVDGVYDLNNEIDQELTDSINYSNIKFEVNGIDVDSEYNTDTKTFNIKLNAYEYENANNSYFYINVKPSSLGFNVQTNKITTGKEFANSGEIVYLDGNNVVSLSRINTNGYKYNSYAIHIKNIKKYKEFTLKFKLNDGSEFTKTFKAGEDFNISKQLEDTHTLNGLNLLEAYTDEIVIYENGTKLEDTKILDSSDVNSYDTIQTYKQENDYISVQIIGTATFTINFNLKNVSEDVSQSILARCTMESFVENDAINISANSDVVVKKDGNLVNDSLTYDVDYLIEYESGDIALEFYSNNILIGTTYISSNVFESNLDNWKINTYDIADIQFGINCYNITFKNLVSVVYEENGGSDSYYVLIDKIIIKSIS